MHTDSSKRMWGAYGETNNKKTNGFWSSKEQEEHINVLELRACQLGLQSFYKDTINVHIKVYIDNTTSVSYINKYGGRIASLNAIARDIWLWCIQRNITLSACHVCGTDNNIADKLSRTGNEDLEWSLSNNVFTALRQSCPSLTIDLFASRLNHKLSKYVSRVPDPKAYAIDAFSISWKENCYYAFPPFSLIPKILQKVEKDGTQLLCLVAPVWPTQAWWPTLIQLIVDRCFLLNNPQNILTLAHRPQKKHPLRKMKLIVFPISGQPLMIKAFQSKLKNSSSNPGVVLRGNSTQHILDNGYIYVKGKEIPLIPI